MKKNNKMTFKGFDEDGYSDDLGDGPSENAVIVADFLPPPDQLVFREDTQKVTIALETKSLDFFKRKAKELGVPYQRMIRNLIEEYAARHKDG